MQRINFSLWYINYILADGIDTYIYQQIINYQSLQRLQPPPPFRLRGARLLYKEFIEV